MAFTIPVNLKLPRGTGEVGINIPIIKSNPRRSLNLLSHALKGMKGGDEKGFTIK